MKRNTQKPLWNILSFASLMIIPGLSQAHIKWFVAYDTLEKPLSVSTVLSPIFWILLAIASICLFAYYYFDRVLYNRPISQKVDAIFADRQYLIPILLRILIGAFLLLLWYQGNTILTPELYTPWTSIAWLQLLMAGFLFCRRTTWLTGIGILLLYALGIYHYNYFHMLDYFFFVGFGFYFIAYSCPHERLHDTALRILIALFALSIMWGAIEKFLYIDWYLLTIFEYPDLHFGMPLRLFLSCAGFVEYTFGFLLLVSLFANRIVTLILMTLFGLAIIEFGKVDLFGHIPFFAVFLAILIYGKSPVKPLLYQKPTGLLLRGLRFLVLYYVIFLAVFASYYGNQYIVAHHNYSHHMIEDPVRVNMHEVSDSGFGDQLGIITIEPRLNGVLFVPQLRGLAPGLHEVRIVNTPNCGIDGKTNRVFRLLEKEYDMRSKPHSFYYNVIKSENLSDILANKRGHAIVPFSSHSNHIRTLENKSIMIYENDLVSQHQNTNAKQRFICGAVGTVKWPAALDESPATSNYEH